MKRALFASAVVALLAACDVSENFVFFERVTTTEGQFRGLVVGNSKEQVLEQIRKLGVYAIRPAPPIDFRVAKRNVEDIGKLEQVDGIRLTGKPGIAVDLFFRDDKVWRVRKSVPAEPLVWFSEGMDRATAMAKLKELLQQDSAWEVLPIVYYEGNGWVVINKTFEEARRAVLPHNAWSFEISSDKPAGAFATVYFYKNALQKIEYRRPRVRLD